MADTIPAAWISDYLIDIAETYGGQIYNTPPIEKKKRVQLTDFLTFHEDSYVWAWASDKTHRIPIRISKDAVEQYKVRTGGRNIVDCRFSPAFIQRFRPIFAPRPYGGTLKGNTPTPHIALDVGRIETIGHGTHIFGEPKDIESHPLLNEWVSGLRQDGGGGNVLKLRKQEQKSANPPISVPARPPTPTLLDLGVAPASKPAVNEQMPEPALPRRPPDFKRAYSKRWRALEIDRWKFAYRTPQQIAEVKNLTEGLPTNNPPIPRTPSPAASVRAGTPTEWSPSPCRNPMQASPSRNLDTEILPSHIHEGVRAEELPGGSERPVPVLRLHNPLQPSAQAQCNKRASPPPSQPKQRSSPLPPSSPLALPSPLANFCKNVKRKVPHPGIPLLRDPDHSGPTQILVPNSDTSGMTSSQPYSQPSQSQAPPFPSSLSNGFKPGGMSTPRKTGATSQSNSPQRVSLVPAEVKSSQLVRDPLHKKELSLKPVEVEVADNSPAQANSGDKLVRAGTNRENEELSDDDAETKAVLQNASCPAAAGNVPSATNEALDPQFPQSSLSSMHSLFSATFPTSPSQEQLLGTIATPNTSGSVQYDVVTSPHDPATWKEPSFIRSQKEKSRAVGLKEEPLGEKSEKKRKLSDQPAAPSKRTKKDECSSFEIQASRQHVQYPIRPPQKAIEDRESSYMKEAPAVSVKHTEVAESDSLTPQSVASRVRSSQSCRRLPRLAGLAVDFTQIPCGSKHPRPRMTWADFQGILLRTGRIRTLGEEVERDGSIYLSND